MLQDRAFKLVAGHPALDFINTLDWRFREAGTEELLASYDDLLRFLSQTELLSSRSQRNALRAVSDSVAAGTLVACRELREAAAVLFYAAVDDRVPQPASIRTIERLFREARNRQRLSFSRPGFRWEWSASIPTAEWPLLLLTESVRGLLLSGDLQRLRACENPECRWLFLDTSKNHTRRWCDMKLCGNRIKARRFKALHKS